MRFCQIRSEPQREEDLVIRGQRGESAMTQHDGGGKYFDSEHPLTRGNRGKGLRDFRNLRTQARVLVPAACDQCPQLVRARTMFRPRRTVASQDRWRDRPVCLLVYERNLTSEYLCWCGNSERKTVHISDCSRYTSIVTIANE